MPPFVTFLSDFGAGDQFAGICHGVINTVCPEAQVIHIGHGVTPQRVSEGALALAGAVPYLPVGVHMAVVDPGVGSQRRAVVLRSADGRLFVGPDNGLLVPAAEACGGVEMAVEITAERFMLDHVSRTFHGRDIFAPVAGHLAAGLDPAEVGPPIDPADLVRCRLPGLELDGSEVRATVQHIDRFGNVQISARVDGLDGLFAPPQVVELEVRGDDRYLAVCVATFADVGPGELVLFQDSDGFLAIAINRGSAAELLDVGGGDPVRIEFDVKPT